MAVSAEKYQIQVIGIGASSYVDTVVYVPSHQLTRCATL